MNVKEYISSGIVESYVLGLLPEAERREFEANCIQYPEVAGARNAFELALEEQLLADASAPPQALKQSILDKVQFASTQPETEEEDFERTPVRRMGVWKWVAAASVILMAAAIYWAVDTNNKYKALQAQNEDLRKKEQESASHLNEMMDEARIMQKDGVKMAALKGTNVSPQSFATIFWDTASQSKDVYLLINNLPQPASDKQYQLWALLDGKPIDLGVFDMEVREQKLMVKMKNVQNAQAFAITLEPKGGSENPTLTSMYVVGNL